ncbi:hypothetical protein [Spirosoma panaciterrae]|uniref:hypothetical protein n=1 Tax=Spirosoma panaciterrae TaxID=496058 RepID=UPI00038050CB|nr:hypothetical protein [Spirosoma panaciterrae]
MKTLYINSIRTLLVLFTISLLFSSCSKKSEPDPLDQYVGTWTETVSNGQTGSGLKVTINKSGTTLTLSDLTPNGGFTASVSGSGFQAENKNIATGVPITFPDNSQGQYYLQNLTGSLSGGNLTLTYTLFSASATMFYKENVTKVFAKK